MKSLRFVFSLLVAVLVTACGGASEEFVGTYSASGTATMSFDGFDDNTSQLSGTVSVSDGVNSDLILTAPGTPGCIVPINMQDGVGRVAMGATCSAMVDGVRLTLTFTSGTATLTGQVIQLTYSGTLTAVYDGSTYAGTFTTSATLMRMGK